MNLGPAIIQLLDIIGLSEYEDIFREEEEEGIRRYNRFSSL